MQYYSSLTTTWHYNIHAFRSWILNHSVASLNSLYLLVPGVTYIVLMNTAAKLKIKGSSTLAPEIEPNFFEDQNWVFLVSFSPQSSLEVQEWTTWQALNQPIFYNIYIPDRNEFSIRRSHEFVIGQNFTCYKSLQLHWNLLSYVNKFFF